MARKWDPRWNKAAKRSLGGVDWREVQGGTRGQRLDIEKKGGWGAKEVEGWEYLTP